MLVDGDLIGTIVAAVVGIDTNLSGLRKVERVGRGVGVQRIVVDALEDHDTTVLGADAGDDMTQIAISIERVDIVDRLVVMIDTESDGV